MSLMSLIAFVSRRAEPGSAEGLRRSRQDAALTALGRTVFVLSSLRSFASFASDAPGT
jgi:hypothetical protein